MYIQQSQDLFKVWNETQTTLTWTTNKAHQHNKTHHPLPHPTLNRKKGRGNFFFHQLASIFIYIHNETSRHRIL